MLRFRAGQLVDVTRRCRYCARPPVESPRRDTTPLPRPPDAAAAATLDAEKSELLSLYRSVCDERAALLAELNGVEVLRRTGAATGHALAAELAAARATATTEGQRRARAEAAVESLERTVEALTRDVAAARGDAGASAAAAGAAAQGAAGSSIAAAAYAAAAGELRRDVALAMADAATSAAAASKATTERAVADVALVEARAAIERLEAQLAEARGGAARAALGEARAIEALAAARAAGASTDAASASVAARRTGNSSGNVAAAVAGTAETSPSAATALAATLAGLTAENSALRAELRRVLSASAGGASSRADVTAATSASPPPMRPARGGDGDGGGAREWTSPSGSELSDGPTSTGIGAVSGAGDFSSYSAGGGASGAAVEAEFRALLARCASLEATVSAQASSIATLSTERERLRRYARRYEAELSRASAPPSARGSVVDDSTATAAPRPPSRSSRPGDETRGGQ